jgi:hypothetical protein
MTRIYEILAWTGWIWTAVFFAFLAFKLRGRKAS